MKPILSAIALGLSASGCSTITVQKSAHSSPESDMQVEYLEIVTPEVEATISTLAAQHGVSFGAPIAALGSAHTADLAGGGRIAVRAPMADHEGPIVRPYLLVPDIAAATVAAKAEGAEFAMEATEIPGEGTFAIYFLGGVQFGLWQK